MGMIVIPEHPRAADCEYFAKVGGCYWCCERCNVDRHQCPGCGVHRNHNDSPVCATCAAELGVYELTDEDFDEALERVDAAIAEVDAETTDH